MRVQKINKMPFWHPIIGSQCPDGCFSDVSKVSSCLNDGHDDCNDDFDDDNFVAGDGRGDQRILF